MTFPARLYFVAALLFPGACPVLTAQSATAIPAFAATTLLKTSTTWNGIPIAYSKSENPEIQSVVVEIAPGSATAWHLHPVNNIAYILEGKLRLELENGTTREFKMGESFAEVVNIWHRGTNIGSGPLKIMVVYIGEVGAPISISKGDRSPGEH